VLGAVHLKELTKEIAEGSKRSQPPAASRAPVPDGKDMETTARYCAPPKKLALRERLDKVKSLNRKRNGLVKGEGG
jgi:hypothetical protein